MILTIIFYILHPYSVSINKENLYNFIGSNKHTFLHFYSPDCPHCEKLQPIWNELTKIYKPLDNITFATVNCDRWKSICSSFDGLATPTVQYFAPKQRKGISYGGQHEIINFVKWIKSNSNIIPYTKPGSIIYSTPNEINELIDQKWILLAIDDPKNNFLNHSEILNIEKNINIDIRAISYLQFSEFTFKYSENKSILLLLNNKNFFKIENINNNFKIEFINKILNKEL